MFHIIYFDKSNFYEFAINVKKLFYCHYNLMKSKSRPLRQVLQLMSLYSKTFG